MAKGKPATKENPKAKTRALPKKAAPKSPAPKKGITTQRGKDKGTSRKQAADEEPVDSSDEELDSRPRKKRAKPSTPASDEEDANEPEDEPEVIQDDDESESSSQNESEVLNSKSDS